VITWFPTTGNCTINFELCAEQTAILLCSAMYMPAYVAAKCKFDILF